MFTRAVAHGLGGTAVRQVDQQQVSRTALDRGADGGAVLSALDQVSVPVAGDRTVVLRGGTLADHDHGVAVAGLALLGLPSGLAPDTSGAQGAGRLAAEFTAPLDGEGPARSSRGPRGSPDGRERWCADLLLTPPSVNVVLDEVAPLWCDGQLGVRERLALVRGRVEVLALPLARESPGLRTRSPPAPHRRRRSHKRNPGCRPSDPRTRETSS